MIDTATIQKLRQETGAGMMDVKKALEEAEGNEEKALEKLRLLGKKIASKKQAEREASDGLVEAYIHMNGKVGSMIVLSCETDFVAKNEEFKKLAHDIAMQVTAMNPEFISRQDVPEERTEKEKEIYLQEVEKDNKPEEIKQKIVEGKLDKYFSEICLVDQKFIKDDKLTIKDLIEAKTAKLGEKIEIKKMIRFAL